MTVNIDAIMKVLPVSSLGPDCVALIGGFIDVPCDRDWQERIWLLEPPAGQRVPYIEPVEALEKLLRGQGVASDIAKSLVREVLAYMKIDIAEDRWVNVFDTYESESPGCLPVSDFVGWLRDENQRVNQLAIRLQIDKQVINEQAGEDRLIPTDILDFFEQAAEVVMSTPMFRGPDNWNEPWSLENLPMLPPPKAMIEFVPGPPWNDFEFDWETQDNQFLRWREAIRPVALELEKALREPVYYFKELGDELDDDNVHRFLVLHWCCTYKPESAFVRYLMKICGANDVEDLKSALIDPVNYTHPFKMNEAFFGMDVIGCRFDYLKPGRRKTVAVVFSTSEARVVAMSLLEHNIGTCACIIAPITLATEEWIKHATRYCRSWEAHYVYDGNIRLIETLALIDELCVIADEKTPGSGFDLKLPKGVEDLLWLALDIGIKAKYFHVDRMHLVNPEDCLVKCGVSERVAARLQKRAGFTRQLTELRIYNDYGSSGLWDENGKMLGYDLLDLPFPLIRRIAAWQRDFDDTVTPPDKSSDTWWERHNYEEIEIAKMLQASLGSDVAVKLYRQDGWLTVNEFSRIDGSDV